RGGAGVVDVTAEEIVVEAAGDPGVIEGLRATLAEYGIAELARSGPIAIRT
ncbi:MAG: acetolactate synthase small subunit, partial [Nocardioides sp.]|nr:acetolactate synthase small subunit [Nocardioides sp.]